MKQISPFLILLFLGNSCTKNSQKPADEVAPSIKISFPSSSEMYAGGQTFCVKASVEDNNSLSQVSVRITGQPGNVLIKEYNYTPSARISVINESFPLPSGLPSSLDLEIRASDLTGNLKYSRLSFLTKQ